MKNIGKRAKRNPWRNTRNDYNVPWNDILGGIFMMILPVIIISLSINVVLRGEFFYSIFFTKTEIAKEIPYEINGDELKVHFSDFMMHQKSSFMIKENNEYKPQDVFTQRSAQVMSSIREIADILLIVTIALLIVELAIVIYLYRQKEKRLIYESFESSVILFAVIMLLFAVSFLVKYVRGLIFKTFYGVRFEAGDVLIQIFKGGFATYFAVASIAVSILMMLGVFYLMNKFVSYRKMFKRNI